MRRSHTLAILFIATLLALPATAQQKLPLKFNYGIKAGFQGITYNTTDFAIEGYSFDENIIQSKKVGFIASPFIRVTKGKFYLQTETAFGITYCNYVFFDTDNLNPAEYELKIYCVKIPLLLGYNFINYPHYGMSVYTGPKASFNFTSLSKQNFAGFNKYADIYEEFDKTEWYWNVGLGIRIYSVVIDFTYDFGILRNKSHIHAPAERLLFKSKRSNNVLSFSAGFIF